ncbi:NAD(P)-binding protein [Violaceomyces palustris]|uniref:NAD(P)-binding protein n=1 Tax=Violaceomyces palustris TaxID=1673888 RepID=A0ACD0P1Z5_9BASI|nr:NAD(P)-binding protein [Violaceomyces palustris]
MSASTTASQPIPVSVIGFGNSARTFHLPFILSLPDRFTLHSIQQRPRTSASSSSSPNASTLFPDVTVLPDLDAVLASLPKDGLIIITTTNETHFPFAKRALEAGFNVLVEKPVATNPSDVQELIRLQSETGKVCAVFQNRRFDGDFLTIQKLLSAPVQGAHPSESAIGLPTYFESRFDRFRPIAKGGWREEVDPESQGGGMLWDLGSHLIDQALYLFGPPTSVTGFVRNQRNQGPQAVDDDWLVYLSYPDSSPLPPTSVAAGTRLGGLRVSLGATCLSTHVDSEQPRFRVEGTRGSYEKRGTDPQENQLKAGWSPKSHGQLFGSYDEAKDPSSIRFGRLTTTVVEPESSTPNEQVVLANQPASSTTPAAAAAAPKQPQLEVADIPTLPGRYIDLFINVADAIQIGREVVAKGGSIEQRSNEIQKVLKVGVERVLNVVKLIGLARKSSKEGRTVKWDEV